MGAGASNAAAANAALSTANLPQPYKKDGDDPEKNIYYSVMPQDEEFKRKGEVLLLEVGTQGFRLLRPKTSDPVQAFAWGQIHSWAHAIGKFTFRYFDDGKKTIVHVVFNMRDVDQLLEHIQTIIDQILGERKSCAISEEEFRKLLGHLRQADASHHLGALRTATKLNYFTSEQGREVLELMKSGFDKVEAAVLFHSRLIDQNHFSVMLEALDTQDDRDNVWHRITQAKKVANKRSEGGGSGPNSP